MGTPRDGWERSISLGKKLHCAGQNPGRAVVVGGAAVGGSGEGMLMRDVIAGARGVLSGVAAGGHGEKSLV